MMCIDTSPGAYAMQVAVKHARTRHGTYSMYVYGHVYMYAYACVYAYVYVCMYIHVYMYVYAYLCIDGECQ